MNGLSASLLIARLALKRTLRGRAVWLTVALLALPTVLAVGGKRTDESWRAVFEVMTLLLAVIPPLHLATAISDEVEDNTFTYLWSRPIPRWSLLTGKLIAVAPALIALCTGAITIAFFAAFGDGASDNLHVLGRAIGSSAVGVMAVGLLAIGFGSILPKQALATVIAYMLMFDIGVGKIPFAINQLSITHHLRAIAGLPDDIEQAANMVGIYETGSVSESVIWCLGLGLAWFGVALWRVRVAEYATSK